MDEDALIAAWRRLPTLQSRKKAIDAFLQELDPYQWRHVHAITGQRSFQTDIIGRLPVELVAHIFAYLDSSTPYQLQRVCRKWHAVLQSTVVVKSRDVLEWYDGARDLSGDDYTLCTQAAKDKHAFRHGDKPHLSYQIKTGQGVDGNLLVGDTLIWLPSYNLRERRAMYMLNMRTWTLRTLTGEAREDIVTTFASEQLVGFTTNNNICYVFDLLTAERRKFRTKNAAMLRAVACRERTVVCAGYDFDDVLVYIWDYDMQIGKSFTVYAGSAATNKHMNHIPGCSKANTLALLPQPATESVIVFIATCKDRCFEQLQGIPRSAPPAIQYRTFHYDGSEIRTGSRIDLSILRTALFHRPYFAGFVPVDTKGTFRIGITGHPSRRRNIVAGRWDSNLLTVFLQFNEQTHAFSIPRLRLGEYTYKSTFWWSETFFMCSDYDTSLEHNPPTNDLLAYVGTAETRCSKTFIRQSFCEGKPGYSVKHLNLVNHTYVVRVCEEGFQVLCYDSNHKRPDTDTLSSDVANLEVIEEGKKEWDLWI